MQCPFCSADNDKVVDSRSAENGRVIRRRRQCNECGRRYTTYERLEETIKLSVVKKDGTRVPYNRQKIVLGVEAACFKRPIAAESLNQLVDNVEETLNRRFDKEVESAEIGKLVAEHLKALDQVAYVRFASVYKQFRDLDDFMEEMREIMATPPDPKGQSKLF
jgi:transcriptional repressor NrdR